MWKITSIAVIVFISCATSQRLLWPVNDYDMSMGDAAELCYQIDLDKGKTDTKREQYLPSWDKCYFYQFIYCPNVPEAADTPCGWWKMQPCNISMLNREPHFALKPANPETKVDIAPVFTGNNTAESCQSGECPNTPCANGWFCLNCVCTARYL